MGGTVGLEPEDSPLSRKKIRLVNDSKTMKDPLYLGIMWHDKDMIRKAVKVLPDVVDCNFNVTLASARVAPRLIQHQALDRLEFSLRAARDRAVG